MQLFYSNDIQNDILFLPENESKHCTKVLRMRNGDTIMVTDGIGNLYEGEIIIVHEKKTEVKIKTIQTTTQMNPEIHLMVAATKNSDRIEWMLEKCVEIGICSFTPITTKRSERKNIRIDRLENIALSAMKQSLKYFLPKINPLTPIEKILFEENADILIAHCEVDHDKMSIQNLKRYYTKVYVMIGPEGDFTPEEILFVKSKNGKSVSLGESRLRTETAGLVACTALYLKR